MCVFLSPSVEIFPHRKWCPNFCCFLADLPERPFLELSLDYLSLGINEQQSNCHWTNRVGQTRAKRGLTKRQGTCFFSDLLASEYDLKLTSSLTTFVNVSEINYLKYLSVLSQFYVKDPAKYGLACLNNTSSTRELYVIFKRWCRCRCTKKYWTRTTQSQHF